MKKVLPFVFPLVALLIVIFLAYRWYNMNTANQTGEINEVGEGVEIENLTETERNNILRGVGDFKKAELKGEGMNRGDIRYELKDGKVNFSVSADLDSTMSGQYQVWVKSGDQPAQKAFVLESTKGGYIGTASLPETALPFEVIVSRETVNDETVEAVVLQGSIKKD